MPELPEVETSVQAIQEFNNQKLQSIQVYNPNLRWKVDIASLQKIKNQMVYKISRRAKYILFNLEKSQLLLHLGMSGTIRISQKNSNLYKKHDHIELVFKKEKIIFNDPRRFGSIHLISSPYNHFLLNKLGPEPLSENFNGEYFYQKIKNSLAPIKSALMNQHNVVGIGNIYANEVLFDARIRPTRKCRTLTRKETISIDFSIKKILNRAIELGGITLNDFHQPDGNMGYFKIELSVYDRADKKCKACKKQSIKKIILAQRATYFCKDCQN